MLQAAEIGGRAMMARGDLAELFESDFEAYVAAMNRRLRVLDAAIAEQESIEDSEAFRSRIASEAVDALTALGVAHPKTTWRLGVLATRAWLLEIASPPVCKVDAKLPGWRGAAIVPPDSPFGEWQLWRYTAALAEGIRERRRHRAFGPTAMTPGDLEEARLGAEISNERWIAIRETALWVFAR